MKLFQKTSVAVALTIIMIAAAIGIVIVTLACVCGLYVHFIQEKVHDESADHLKEILFPGQQHVLHAGIRQLEPPEHMEHHVRRLRRPLARPAPFPATTPSRRASS